MTITIHDNEQAEIQQAIQQHQQQAAYHQQQVLIFSGMLSYVQTKLKEATPEGNPGEENELPEVATSVEANTEE